MESSHTSSSSSSPSSSPSSPPPRCKKPKYTGTSTLADEDIHLHTPASATVAALRRALVQSSSANNNNTLILTHLRRVLSLLHSTLTSSTSPAHTLCASGFLDLLPSLLTHSSFKVGKKSAEAVGLLAIASYEVSCRLAEKQEILSALVHLLHGSKPDVLLIAVHSILNVATSELGCAALRDVAGLPQQLLRLVSFLADTLAAEIVKAGDRGTFRKSHERPNEGDLDVILPNLPPDEKTELFDAALAAVNTIFQGFGPVVALFTRPDVFASLRSLWQRTMTDSHHKVGPAAEYFLAPNTRTQLAKLITRLAMQIDVDDAHHTFDARRFFGNDVEHFFQKHWELSPALGTVSTAVEKLRGLSSFMEKVAGSGGPAQLLKLLVDGMVACPPAVADELDSLVLYKDMEHELGLLPTLNQDIRLVKCTSGAEIPYPMMAPETSSVSSRDCIKAYASGNTVVIRGLQFRCPEISVISNGLAVELGQVTVGANLYLTPPGSQGLAAHFDDHCVFVCQLRGHKQWSVSPPLEEPLPRLYSCKPLSTQAKQERATTTYYDLQVGDLLYIPRGFLHEARTLSFEADVKKAPTEGFAASCSGCSCYNESPMDRTSFNTDQNHRNSSDSNTSSEWHGASLHLSFGVEVEPAFEWEGLLHIALRLWSLQHATPGVNTSPSIINQHEICEILLHVAIGNVGSSSEPFRKACIVRNNGKEQNAEADKRMFHFMLNQVRESAGGCHRAVECYRVYGVAWLDWLRHVSPGGRFNTDLYHVLVDSCSAEEGLDSAFDNVRDRFCQEASFLESIAAQGALLCKFRNSRQKVMNGLLALHCGL